MKSSPLRLVIADDHPAVLSAVKSLLADVPDWTVVGTANDARQMVSLLGKRQRTCDVLVTDYLMPCDGYEDGTAMLHSVRQRCPDLNIVVLTMLNDPDIVRNLLQIGLSCIVSKSDDLTHVIAAVHAAANGERYVSPALAMMVTVLEESDYHHPRIPSRSRIQEEIRRRSVAQADSETSETCAGQG